MDDSRFYYASPGQQHKGSMQVCSLGIHEKMPPGIISHGGAGCPYLLILFHNSAYIDAGTSRQTEAEHGLILWDRGSFHVYGNASCEWDHSWMNINGEAAGRILKLHKIPLNKPLFIDAEKEFLHYLSLLHVELSKCEKPDLYVIERLFELMVHGVARIMQKEEKGIPENISIVRDYICQNICASPSLSELARMACLSIPQFSAVFKRYYGLSPINYLHRQRMGCAAELLRFHNLSVKEVSVRVGYNDQLYFSRQFRKVYGKSPTDYRS